MISASTSSSCSGRRTSTASVPSRSSVARCSAKSPWRPRTPARATSGRVSPTADGKTLCGRDRLEGEAAHRLAQPPRNLGDESRVAEVRRGLDDRFRAARRIRRLEDPRADEVALSPELHHERGVRWRGDPAGAEEHDGQPSLARHAPHELHRNAVLVGFRGEPRLIEIREGADRLGDRTDVPDGFDDVPGPGLALAADHRGTLVDPAQRFAKLARSADEWDVEIVLLDVIFLVSRREDFALVDVVD